jgi:hypothetical protein
MIPVNAIAQNIVQLQSDNEFYLSQVAKNNEMIEQLQPLAEWSDSAEPASNAN